MLVGADGSCLGGKAIYTSHNAVDSAWAFVNFFFNPQFACSYLHFYSLGIYQILFSSAGLNFHSLHSLFIPLDICRRNWSGSLLTGTVAECATWEPSLQPQLRARPVMWCSTWGSWLDASPLLALFHCDPFTICHPLHFLPGIKTEGGQTVSSKKKSCQQISLIIMLYCLLACWWWWPSVLHGLIIYWRWLTQVIQEAATEVTVHTWWNAPL